MAFGINTKRKGGRFHKFRNGNVQMNFFVKLGQSFKPILVGALLSLLLYAADNTIFSFIVNSNLTGFDVIIGNVLPVVLLSIILFRVYRSLQKIWRSK